MTEIRGNIHSIETFGSVDGPGVRFIVFLKGCNLRCLYCHNADTWDKHSDDQRSADEILKQALRYKEYWGKDSGITVSGGEPLLQMEFLTDLFQKAKKLGISTCIDTAGQPFTKEEPWFSQFETLMEYTDLLLMDIKHIDREKHIRLTGRTNDNIKEMFRYLSDIRKPIWIRYVLVPGYSDDPEDVEKTAGFISTLNNVEKVEVLPYHSMGAFKWEKLGIPYQLKDVKSPSREEAEHVQNILRGAVRG